MGSISNFLENELLDHIFNAAYTPPANVFIGLSTADPLDDASGLAEPVGNNYSRVTITFATAASRAVDQKAKVTFPTASGAWGTLTHYGIFDAVSAGNMLAHGALNTSKGVVNGNVPYVTASEVNISFATNEVANYLAHQLLDHAFRNANYTAPNTYVALLTANATNGGTGSSISEPGSSSYARKQININGGATPTWTLASNGALENNDQATFAAPTGSWGAITALAIVDGSSGGNLLMYENTVVDQTPDNGDTVRINAGDLDVSLS